MLNVFSTITCVWFLAIGSLLVANNEIIISRIVISGLTTISPNTLYLKNITKGYTIIFCILDNCISSDFNTGYLIQRKIFCKLLLFVLLISYIFTYFTATTKINLQNNSYHCILIHAIFLFAEIINFLLLFGISCLSHTKISGALKFLLMFLSWLV